MRIYFWGWILRVAQKRTIKGAWQTWVPALLGDSGFSHRNCWGPRPLDPREAKTHSLESPLASDSRLPMSGLLWSLINLLTFLISAVLWVHKCICFILYYLLCTYVSMLVYHLWLRHCFEAPHPLSLVFCCSLSGERVVVSFCLKGKCPPVLLLLHQLPSLPYPLLPDGPCLGGRWGSASVSMRYRRSGFMVVGSLSYAVVAYGWDQSFLPHPHTSQITFLVPDWWPLLLNFYCRLYLQWKLPIEAPNMALPGVMVQLPTLPWA